MIFWNHIVSTRSTFPSEVCDIFHASVLRIHATSDDHLFSGHMDTHLNGTYQRFRRKTGIDRRRPWQCSGFGLRPCPNQTPLTRLSGNLTPLPCWEWPSYWRVPGVLTRTIHSQLLARLPSLPQFAHYHRLSPPFSSIYVPLSTLSFYYSFPHSHPLYQPYCRSGTPLTYRLSAVCNLTISPTQLLVDHPGCHFITMSLVGLILDSPTVNEHLDLGGLNHPNYHQ